MGMLRAGLDAEAYDREYSNRELISRLAAYFRPWLGRFVIIVICVTLFTAAQTGAPLIAARGVEFMSDAERGVAISAQRSLSVGGGIDRVGRLHLGHQLGAALAYHHADWRRGIGAA